MIIYNVTIKIHDAIHQAWLQWLNGEHIPEVLGTNCFIKSTVLRLLDIDDSDGPTYAIQYFAEDLPAYYRYIEKFAAIMREKSFEKWGDKFTAFRSVMEVVSLPIM